MAVPSPALVGKPKVLKGTPDTRSLKVAELVRVVDPSVLPVIAQMTAHSAAKSLREISIGVFENEVNLQERIAKFMPYTAEVEDCVKVFLMVFVFCAESDFFKGLRRCYGEVYAEPEGL